MLGGPLWCLDTVCCRWPAALIDTKLVTTLALSGMLNGSYPEHTATTLCRPICAPSKRIRRCDADYTRKTRTGIAKKQFFSFFKANTKADWRPVGIQQPPLHPPNPNAILQLFRNLEHVEAARVEDMSGTHRLVSAVLQSSWPERHRRIATSQELQLRPPPSRWTAL